VWAQRYDASNNPVGARIQVNTAPTDTNDYNRTGVAAAPDGGFLVVWDDVDINARRFDAAGVPLTAQFTVNTDPVGTYEFPAVASNADGDFAVVWRDYSGVGTFENGIFGQRFDADANFVGGEFQVSEYGDAFRNRTAVAPDGTVMVLGWPYGPDHDLTARIYDPSGNPTTPEFDIDFDADMFGVDADRDGNFVVVWRTYPYWVVKGRRFSPAGTPLDDVFTVSEKPQYGAFDPTASFPDVATDADGDFVVVWNNNYYGYYGAAYQYKNLMGAWARRMAVCGNGHVGPDDPCDDGNTTPLDGCSATCRVETCHTCTGDPSVCSPLAGCAAVCTDPAAIQPSTAILTFKGLGAPTGDEGFVFKGKVANPPLQHLEYDPSAEGAEVALTTTGTVYALAGTTRIPPGLVGTGCDAAHDGWKAKPGSYVYKNVSGALPPACTPGSANAVRVLKMKDKLDRDGTLLFRVKARNATIGLVPQPPLVATLVLGQSPAAGAAGRCGQITFTGVLGSRFFP
jgi:cysteine-rich repeat protein